MPVPLFNKCQKGYRKNKKLTEPRSTSNPMFPLRNKITCDECKTSLTGSSSTGNKGVKYPYYHHRNTSCSKTKSIPKKVLEKLFINHLKEITPDAKYEKLFKAIVLDIWETNHKKFDEVNNKTRKQINTLKDERQKIFELHRSGKYSDQEFIEQKGIIKNRIEQQRLLIQDKWEEEVNMEEVLKHCFNFIRNTAKTWIAVDHPTRIQFQNLIFSGKLEFDGKKFGTDNLSLIYQLKKTSQCEKSSLVAFRRFSWNQLIQGSRKGLY